MEKKRLFSNVCDRGKTGIKSPHIAGSKECAVFMKGLVSMSLIPAQLIDCVR